MSDLREDNAAPRDLGPADADVAQPVPGEPYNPARDREKARSALAFGALVLLAGVLALIGVPVAIGKRDWAEVEGLAAALLPATLSIVGAAIGFYFGTGEP